MLEALKKDHVFTQQLIHLTYWLVSETSREEKSPFPGKQSEWAAIKGGRMIRPPKCMVICELGKSLLNYGARYGEMEDQEERKDRERERESSKKKRDVRWKRKQ